MKHDYSLWGFAGFSLTSLVGTLLHFLYDWTDGNILAAPFSGINESTWEHMKLLYVPLLLFALAQRRTFRDVPAFWCIKLFGMVTGLVLIPVLFYTLNGAFGKTPDFINIAIFFVSVAATFFLETRLFRRNVSCRFPRLAKAGVLLIGILFFVFTFWPPQLPLFIDPTKNARP